MRSGNGRDDARITELAIAAGRGDRAALEQWVRETQADVWRFVAHLAGAGVADDLCQDTYARAVTSLSRFAGRSSARTWLLSIARYVVVDHFRARGSRPVLADRHDWEAAAEAQRPASGGFEDLVETGILLANLDPDRREALVLTQVLGYSYAEVAQICDCPIGTVRSRVARAREDLLAQRDEPRSAM